MSRTIRLATLFPSDLDLNGDQANLLVLLKRLEYRGVKAEIVELNDPSNLDFDLVFLGHGSMAAWAEIDKKHPDLAANLLSAQANGAFVFAVNSGYLKLASDLGIQRTTGTHRSEFVEVDGKVGYLNSNAEVDLLSYSNTALLTMLHGPVLVKNPELADKIIQDRGWADISIWNEKLERISNLAKRSREIAFEH